MITAGVDIGIENVKVVILKDGQVVARSTASSGGADRGASAEKAFHKALASAGIKEKEVQPDSRHRTRQIRCQLCGQIGS